MQLKSTARMLTSLASGKVLANAPFSADRVVAGVIGFDVRLQQQVSGFQDFSAEFMRDLASTQSNMERLGQVRNPEVFAEYKKRQEELRQLSERENSAHALQTQALSDFKKLAQNFNQSRVSKTDKVDMQAFSQTQQRIQAEIKQVGQTYEALHAELAKLDRIVKQSIINAGVVLPAPSAQAEQSLPQRGV